MADDRLILFSKLSTFDSMSVCLCMCLCAGDPSVRPVDNIIEMFNAMDNK